jgi:beta-glucanase (GH16 family)
VLPAGWHLVLNERFLSLDNFKKWDILAWDTQCLPENVSLISGGARIAGNYEAGTTNSGEEISSLTTYLYGYFECRFKLPSGSGVWPAFWLYNDTVYGIDSNNNPEIDIVETIGPNQIHCNNHLEGTYGGFIYDTSSSLYDQFHKFAAKWTSTLVTFYYDDVQIGTIAEFIPQTALMIWFSFFVAGWAGTPSDPGPWTKYLDIDYVRVWQDI